MQIDYTRSGSASSCTLGVNAKFGALRGFITASRCTAKLGGNDGTTYTHAARYLGQESFDPYWNRSDCSILHCRYSDAAFVWYNGSASADFGYIARPAVGTPSGYASTIALDGSRGFRIVDAWTGSMGGLAVGVPLDKVGITTGWTRGAIANTCTNGLVRQPGDPQAGYFTVKCATVVNSSVDQGDSGSPVFQTNQFADANDVRLYGILFGSINYGTQYLFATWDNVESDFGGDIVVEQPRGW